MRKYRVDPGQEGAVEGVVVLHLRLQRVGWDVLLIIVRQHIGPPAG